MKLLICGDLHLTSISPQNRKDNYEIACLKKLNFILSTALEEKCNYILQPGDFFDSPVPSYDFFSKVYNAIDISIDSKKLWTIYGQHDMRYRRIENTGLNALQAVCDKINIATINSPNWLCGISFESQLPEKIEQPVLMTHRMIVKEKLWTDQTNFEYGSSLMEKYPKTILFVTGDNHQNFVLENKNQVLINAGSLMRSTIAQVNHQPKIYIVDIDTDQKIILDAIEIDIPIEPAENVFQLDKIEHRKELDENIMAYIEGLKGHKAQDLKFEDDLASYLLENKIEQPIIDILNNSKKERK